MNLLNKLKISITVVLVTMAMVSGYIVFGAGGSDDPLVSQSYIETVVIPKIMKQVEEKLGSSPSTSFGDGTVFKSVQVFAEQTIIGKEGSEIILRVGNATAVCPGENGLVDATSGLDLLNGNAIEKNHIYIVPRYDNRGIKMSVDGFVMVKGGYDLK